MRFYLILGVLMSVVLGCNLTGCIFDTSGLPTGATGSGGSGGEGSTSIASSSGNTGGGTSHVSSSSGGTGGTETTSTSSSSVGGGSSTSSTSSSTGTGGSGGGDPVVPTCLGGNQGTVASVTASGAIETALLVHYQDGMETFSALSPTVVDLNAKVLPAQLVLLGKEGAQFDLKQQNMMGVARTYYKVELATLPQAVCQGANLNKAICLTQVAKAFRCEFPPYLETNSCPSWVSFTPLGSSNKFTSNDPGYQMLLVHLSCL